MPRPGSRPSTCEPATSTASSTRWPRTVATLEAAVRLARLLAAATLVEHEVEVDAAAVAAALAGIREQLEFIRTLKSQLTSISTATKAVWGGLDTLRTGILARVAEAESELRVAG